jgi:hypothetical protein
MKTIISSTTLARNLGDCLARVKYRSEDFLITKNDEVVAELKPAGTSTCANWGAVAETMRSYPSDPSFADDLEKVYEMDVPPENPLT